MNLDQHQQRYIALEGTLNLRDLGGYLTGDGRLTRYGRLLRSDNLDQLPPINQIRLLNYGVGTIVDLREGSETETYPNVFAKSGSVIYLHLPMWNQTLVAQKDALDDRRAYYRMSLDRGQAELRDIMSSIAESDPDRAVLFHCAAGKDRTGLIAALALGTANVAPDIIAEDYALSAEYLSSRVVEWRKEALASGVDMARFDRQVASDAEVMLDTLKYIEQTYGGVPTYLARIGLSESQLKALHDRLVE